jgi:hypothetical protein
MRSAEKIKERVMGIVIQFGFFSLAGMADGGVDQGEETLDFQILTPHPNPPHEPRFQWDAADAGA